MKEDPEVLLMVAVPEVLSLASVVVLAPAVGAAVGAASGYIYDAYKKEQASEYNAGYDAGKNKKPANAPN